jgi:hypothetical protein
VSSSAIYLASYSEDVENMLSNQLPRLPLSSDHMEMEGADMGGSDHNYRRWATATCIRTAIERSIYKGGWHCY